MTFEPTHRIFQNSKNRLLYIVIFKNSSYFNNIWFYDAIRVKGGSNARNTHMVFVLSILFVFHHLVAVTASGVYFHFEIYSTRYFFKPYLLAPPSIISTLVWRYNFYDTWLDQCSLQRVQLPKCAFGLYFSSDAKMMRPYLRRSFCLCSIGAYCDIGK